MRKFAERILFDSSLCIKFDNPSKIIKNGDSIFERRYLMTAKLEALNKKVVDLTQKRNDTLRELREQCRHIKLVEICDGSPPRRICTDCGAEEEGWGCGYQVLAMDAERRNVPHGKKRVIVLRTSDRAQFYNYRKDGPVYFVGQSHPNFARGGIPPYKQLTKITK